MLLTEKVKNLPLSPGVYIMKDSHGQIIYVGKAKKLKNRVQSYFQNSKNHSPKVNKLKKHLKDFDYILTDTEFEALLRECQLIKKHKPLYNRIIKNPQSFTYIVIKMDKKFRQIEIAHNPIEHDGNLYFGPFTSKSRVEKAIQGIKECFKLCCSNPTIKNTACLNYSLGLCLGMCLGGPAVQQYNEIIDKFIAFLQGNDKRILEDMKQMMVTASEKFEFEAASKYRDHIQTVSALLNKEMMIEFTEENHNLVIIEKLNETTIKLFLIKRTNVLYHQKFSLDTEDKEQLIEKIKTNIITYFNNHVPIPSTGVSKDEIDEAQIIYSYLKSNNCSYFTIPEKWLNTENHSSIDVAVSKLLRDVEVLG
ncbi:GIY-YIG nuclease family protein [Bacillus sp. FJAT-49705]|uniref:GIY-YIG nuclease family protein n=1 Tax=Cytobacillus citreus TaxID=2833586 RepID=A0ABS5NU80_9BACI|nr:GIY-YIG nuclease family protein [Cytobacillus citreus]